MHVLPHACPRTQTLQHDRAGPSGVGVREESTSVGESAGATESARLNWEPVVTVNSPSGRASIVTVPSRSVRYTRAPALVHSATTSAAGCPYWLWAPTEMTAIWGRVFAAHDSVLPFQLPWWATFRTCTWGIESCSSQYPNSYCSESPVRSARNCPYSSRIPTDPLFCSSC